MDAHVFDIDHSLREVCLLVCLNLQMIQSCMAQSCSSWVATPLRSPATYDNL